MRKIGLLLNIKQKVIYHNFRVWLVLAVTWLTIFTMVFLFLNNSQDKIQVLIHNQGNQRLLEQLMQTTSNRLLIKESELAAGIKEVESYRAEILIEIPPTAFSEIVDGKSENIFRMYSLKNSAIAGFLADRIVSNSFYEIYLQRGLRYYQNLLQILAESDGKIPNEEQFKQSVANWYAQLKQEDYFKIFIVDGQSRFDEENVHTSRLRLFGALIMALGVNYIFLMYFGVKLLSIHNKDDRMSLLGYRQSHQIGSDLLVLVITQGIPQMFLAYLMNYYGHLEAYGYYLGGTILFILVQLLLIRIVKEKRFYFPLGMAIYLIMVVIGIYVI